MNIGLEMNGERTSLKCCLGELGFSLDKAHVLHVKDVGEKGGVIHLPLYMAPLIVSRSEGGRAAE